MDEYGWPKKAVTATTVTTAAVEITTATATTQTATALGRLSLTNSLKTHGRTWAITTTATTATTATTTTPTVVKTEAIA